MPRFCRVHPEVRISSDDEMFDGVCGRCEMEASYEEPVSCIDCDINDNCPGFESCPKLDHGNDEYRTALGE